MTVVKFKKSSVAGKIPLTTDLEYGEPAINYTDGKLYYKNSGNFVDYIGNGGTFTNALYLTTSTQSTSTGTGALIVTGGVGVGGNIYASGNIVLKSTAFVSDPVSTSTQLTTVTLDSFSTSTYRSAKYVVSISNPGVGQYQTSDITLVHDGATSYIQANSVFSGNKAIMNFTTQISGGNVLLQGAGNQTGANTNTVKVSKTYIPV
jgi:hypothetical protein